MADFIPYQHATSRDKSGGVVRLSAERWRALVEYVQRGNTVKYDLENVILQAAVTVNGILFLPALYQPA